jgi:hypothetical protein
MKTKLHSWAFLDSLNTVPQVLDSPPSAVSAKHLFSFVCPPPLVTPYRLPAASEIRLLTG